MLKLVLALKKELILIKNDLFWYDEKFNSEDILIYFEEILINTDLKEKRNYTKN